MATPLLGSALAQDGVGGPSFLVYHTRAGPDADPLAVAFAPATDRLPLTRFDRAENASAAPEGAPQSAPAHFREMQRILRARETAAAPLSLEIVAELREAEILVHVDASASATVELVLFEHGARLEGRPQPYVARAMQAARSADAGLAASFALDPSWEREHLGVVAIALDNGTIVQSVTWHASRPGAIAQRSKGVLIEHVTASGCLACGPADEAFALLADQNGAAGALDAGPGSYFRAPGAGFYAGLLLGLAAFALAVRRRPA